MEFQFGTNWSRYSTFVGDIFGSPLAAEGVFAFFLESSFLGILLFGRQRVGSTAALDCPPCWWRWARPSRPSGSSSPTPGCRPPRATRSSGDKAVLTDFWAAVFNPSTLPRYLHTVDRRRGRLARSSWSASRPGTCSRGVTDCRSAHASASGLVSPSSPRPAHVRHRRRLLRARWRRPSRPSSPPCRGSTATTSGAPLVIFSLPPAQDPAAAVNRPGAGHHQAAQLPRLRELRGRGQGPRGFPQAIGPRWPRPSSLPQHGRAGHDHAARHARRGVRMVARAARDVAALAVGCGHRHAGAAHRGAARLGDGRDRPPAVDRLRRDAHGRRTSPVVSAPEILASIIVLGLALRRSSARCGSSSSGADRRWHGARPRAGR